MFILQDWYSRMLSLFDMKAIGSLCISLIVLSCLYHIINNCSSLMTCMYDNFSSCNAMILQVSR
jgi:hypothetical protein